MENIDLKKRQTNDINKNKESKITLFLYDTFMGRLILKPLTSRFISKFIGIILDTRISAFFIPKFIKMNNIDMDDYPKTKYKSFNEFFKRKIIKNKRKIATDLISPCDSKLLVYKLNKDNQFKIKNNYYSINNIIKDDKAKEYINGHILIFRLCVDDYHRYSYIDDGYKSKNIYINGKFHTVRPIALKKYDIYNENAREWSVLTTKNYGEVIQIEVGALMVGKIVNHHEEYTFKKGEEKGYFEFGASTICLLFKKNTIQVDKEILNNSKNNLETIVKLGENIGKKLD